MKITIMTALAAATFALAPLAHASEGNGDPFPFAAPGTMTTAQAQVADTGSEAFPNVAGRPGSALAVVADGLLPGVGSEAPVQTAGSLPTGFEVGTPSHAYAQSVNRHFAAQAERTRVTYAARAQGGPLQN